MHERVLSRKPLSLLMVLSLLLSTLPGLRAQTSAVVNVTNFSPFGSWPGYISGKVTGVNPAGYKLALLVFVSGLGWYSKPYCADTTTSLAADGSFNILTTSGGVDDTATRYALALVPAATIVTCYMGEIGIPAALQQQAVTIQFVDRPNPNQRKIVFAGETWLVKSNRVPLGPDSNNFTESTENAWVDGAGKLHVRITNRGGKWYCPEFYTERTVGYGRYEFKVETTPNLDKNVIVGFFTWADGELDPTEIDQLELGKFGNSSDLNNAQYVVQPYRIVGNQHRFVLPNQAPTIHTMLWKPGYLNFKSQDQFRNILHEWTYGGSVPVPQSVRLNFRINAWLFGSNPPSDGNEAEIVVSEFSYAAGPLKFVGVKPCRVADTRDANGPFGGPYLPASGSRSFAIPASNCNIPSTVKAYALNVTVVPRAPVGFLNIYPTGQNPPPFVSLLNSVDGRIKANAAIVPAGKDGAVTLFTTGDTDVVLDINGYFVGSSEQANGLAFYPLTPCRVADTRNATGALGGPRINDGQTRSFPIQQSGCSVPANAQAYMLNLTAVPSGVLGFLTTWPTGETMPLASTLNSPTGTVVANAAIVPAGSGGAVSVFSAGTTDLVIDVTGYFAPASASSLYLYTVNPCRVLDTRESSGAPILSGARDFSIGGKCGAPSDAKALSLNATVVPQPTLGYLALWPTGGTQPLVSSLNSWDGSIVSNAVVVPAGTNGAIGAFASDPAHLIVDINGYFAQ